MDGDGEANAQVRARFSWSGAHSQKRGLPTFNPAGSVRDPGGPQCRSVLQLANPLTSSPINERSEAVQPDTCTVWSRTTATFYHFLYRSPIPLMAAGRSTIAS